MCMYGYVCELLGIRAEVEFARIWAEMEVESSSTARIFPPLRILTSHNGSQNPHRREYSARRGFCEPLWACIGLRLHLTLQKQYPERRRRSDTTNIVLPASNFAEALDHAEDFANRYGLPPWPLWRIQYSAFVSVSGLRPLWDAQTAAVQGKYPFLKLCTFLDPCFLDSVLPITVCNFRGVVRSLCEP